MALTRECQNQRIPRAFASLKIIVFICLYESENVRNSVVLCIIWYGLIIKSNCYSKPLQALYYVTPVNLFDEHLEHNTNDYSDYSPALQPPSHVRCVTKIINASSIFTTLNKIPKLTGKLLIFIKKWAVWYFLLIKINPGRIVRENYYTAARICKIHQEWLL